MAISVGVHTVAGAVSGAINSAITGSNVGMGMLTGAVGAGIGAAAGGALTLLKVDQFGYQLVASTVMGGVAGGIVSEIYGGNFWQGFAQGAATAAAGFLFNQVIHKDRGDMSKEIRSAPADPPETFHSDLYWSCLTVAFSSPDVLRVAGPLVFGCLATPPPWHFITCPAAGVIIALPIASECGDYATYKDAVGPGKPPSFYPAGFRR